MSIITIDPAAIERVRTMVRDSAPDDLPTDMTLDDLVERSVTSGVTSVETFARLVLSADPNIRVTLAGLNDMELSLFSMVLDPIMQAVKQEATARVLASPGGLQKLLDRFGGIEQPQPDCTNPSTQDYDPKGYL